MQLLFMDCKNIQTRLTFKSNRPGQEAMADIGRRGNSLSYSDIVAVFVCVESKDTENPTVSEQGTEAIATTLKELGRSDVVIIPFVHLTVDIAPPKYAYMAIKEMRRRLVSEGFRHRDFEFGWHRQLMMEVFGGDSSIVYKEI